MKDFKRVVVLFVVFAFAKACPLQAQEFKGIATYQSKMTFKRESNDSLHAKMSTQLSPEMAKALKNALAKAGEAEYTLKFDRKESLYEKVEELATPKPTSGVTMTFSGGGATDGLTYKNIGENTFLREDQIQGKDFLVSDKLPTYDWHIDGESKMIGQYQAIKATYTIKAEKKEPKEGEEASLLDMIPDEDKVVTAWFTPQIPVSNGPGAYHGLPGLILELNDGNTTLLCNKIELNPKKFELIKPKKGKKINSKDFDELQEKKQKEIMERFKGRGGEGNFIIQTIGG